MKIEDFQKVMINHLDIVYDVLEQLPELPEVKRNLAKSTSGILNLTYSKSLKEVFRESSNSLENAYENQTLSSEVERLEDENEQLREALALVNRSLLEKEAELERQKSYRGELALLTAEMLGSVEMMKGRQGMGYVYTLFMGYMTRLLKVIQGEEVKEDSPEPDESSKGGDFVEEPPNEDIKGYAYLGDFREVKKSDYEW